MAVTEIPRRVRATVADVARAARVSTATVSRVINSPDVVALATRARVVEAIETLDYRPNAAARTLAGAATATMGLILPELSGPFFSELLSGVEEVARASGLHLLVAATEPDDTLAPTDSPFDSALADGTIVLPHAVGSLVIERLIRAGRPIVLVERTNARLPSVSFDGAAGATQAVHHLVEVHDRRRIAFLGGPIDSEASNLRRGAYASVLVDAGIPSDRRLIVHGAWSETDGVAMVGHLDRAGVDFDAVFAANDEMAIGAIRALERSGRRVPGQVAVVGFDDIVPARWVRPTLTTVVASPRVLGAEAARTLIALIRGEAVEPAARIPTSLVIRASCGCQYQEE